MVIVAQSFGRETEYRRVVLAILSYFSYHNHQFTKVLLFTDNPTWFEQYFEGIQISYVMMNAEKIKNMRGKIDFLHRMKIALIEEAFAKYPEENLFYIDSDTFFIADPSSLEQQLSTEKSFMHLWEYQFEALRNLPLPAGETFQAFVRLIEQKTFTLADGKTIDVNATMSSWNAGVMLLHHTHAAFIPDVYALTDQFYPETKNHASEQYAFSILLQKNTRLEACDTVIYHYWYNVKKAIIDEYLPQKLEQLCMLKNKNERLAFVKKITDDLPSYFEQHIKTYKDNAIQKFNDNKYGEGLGWAIKAIFKGGMKDLIFMKDILYHTKRKLFR